MKKHRWSGWPGAYCLDCGAEHALENAIALGWYDPCLDKWDSEEHKLEVEKADSECRVMYNKTLYNGSCEICKRTYNVILLSKELIPPPIIKIGCQCNNPPPQVSLMYKGNTQNKCHAIPASI